MKNCKPDFVVPQQSSRRTSGFQLVYVFCCLLFAATAVAQQGRDPFSTLGSNTSETPTYRTQGAVLLLAVKSDNKTPLDRQSVVTLRNTLTGTTLWQTTTDQSQASFGDLGVAAYEVEVSAVGYLTTHKPVRIQTALGVYHEEIVLERDPTSVELNAPNAKQLPKKARKAILRGVAALKSGDYKEAEKRLDTARKAAPNSGDVNFLSGYLAFQQKHYDVAKDYLRAASTLDPHNLQAFTLLGRICLQQEDYKAGLAALKQAVAINPLDWMAHELLAETYLKQQQFEKAREQAQTAIECNKVASSGAQLVLGEALAHLGRGAEAVEALKSFLRQAPDSPVAPQVHDLISEVERMPVAAMKAAASVSGPDPRLASAELRFHAMNWQPPGIDDAKPEVAAGVACPTEKVVEMAGQRVKELADDVERFAAIEDLLHERLDETGFPTTKETRKFNYVASVSETAPGFLEVNEYRSERTGLDNLPDHIASNGFVSLALVFHPAMRDNFEMVCEGLGDWHGQATWLVHFKQRPDRPNHFHSYVVNGTVYPVALKGRAWIKADRFQIVHMESELVAPAPAIQLLAEHQIVDYGPVPFGKKEELWLPHSAELYFNFRNRRYFRRHSFDHFMLFSVDSAEKRNEPKEPAQPAARNSN